MVLKHFLSGGWESGLAIKCFVWSKLGPHYPQNLAGCRGGMHVVLERRWQVDLWDFLTISLIYLVSSKPSREKKIKR